MSCNNGIPAAHAVRYIYNLDDSKRACDSDKPILSILRMSCTEPLISMSCVAAPMLLRGYLQPAVNCQPIFCRVNSQSRQAHHLRNTFTMHAMERQFVETQRRCRWHECSTDVNHATVVKIACQHDELLQKDKISDEKNARIRQSGNSSHGIRTLTIDNFSVWCNNGTPAVHVVRYM